MVVDKRFMLVGVRMFSKYFRFVIMVMMMVIVGVCMGMSGQNMCVWMSMLVKQQQNCPEHHQGNANQQFNWRGVSKKKK